MRASRRKHGVTNRLDAQVIEIEQTGSRLEEHDILSLGTSQRHMHQLPITEPRRVIIDIIRRCQFGLRIGKCIKYLQRREIQRIGKRTDNNGVAICIIQIRNIHDLTAVRRRTIGLIIVDETAPIELYHHRVETTVEFRQHDIGVEVSRGSMDTERMAVITTYFLMSA